MTQPCPCGRRPRGFYFMPPRPGPFEPGNSIACCSMTCMGIAKARRGIMDLSVDEKKAVAAVHGKVGEYLEAIGKSDLEKLTMDEWLGFIAHAYRTVSDEVRAIWEKDCPF